MTENWRTPTNGEDYFLHQQKRLALEQRRPAIRKASDLVGPGIGSVTVKVTDFNDLLATYNGYFSAEKDTAANAPGSEDLAGWTAVDSDLGGVQVLVGLVSGNRYVRTFRRAPFDPATITWSPWSTDYRIPPSGRSTIGSNVTVPNGATATPLTAPTLFGVSMAGVMATSGNTILLSKQGVYTGSVRVSALANFTLTVNVTIPFLASTDIISMVTTRPGDGFAIPITVINTATAATTITVDVGQSSGSSQTVRWDGISLTRTGDAV